MPRQRCPLAMSLRDVLLAREMNSAGAKNTIRRRAKTYHQRDIAECAALLFHAATSCLRE